MKHCTFRPETNLKSQVLVERQNLNYNSKEQLCQRLYKHAQTKDKYLQNLKALKEHVELKDCTFKPELYQSQTNNGNNRSEQVTSRGMKEDQEVAFDRLHHQHEVIQRNRVKKENMSDQQFKENHPFHPNRVTKQKDSRFHQSKTRENSKQRADRMYHEWKDREERIAHKKKELLEEEEKLKKMTMFSS